MSFTYSGNPNSSTKDRLRFLVGDIDNTDYFLQDEEIGYVINTYDNEAKQLAVLYRQMASHFGAKCIKRTLGPQQEDPTARLTYFKEMAAKYEKDCAYLGIPPVPDYDYDKVFAKGMMSNED